MIAQLTQNESQKNARLVISARLISDFGAFLNMVALSTYVYLLSNSAIMLGVFLACRVFGGLFVSIIGTALYRQWPGKKLLILFDLIRACLLGMLIIVPESNQLAVLPFIGFGIGLGNAVFSIGLNSQLPNLVRKEHLLNTNAWISSMASTGAVLGSLVSGIVIAGFGYKVIFVFNVITYLVAALFIVFLKIKTNQFEKKSSKMTNEWRMLRNSLRAAPVLAAMLLVTMADTLGSAAHNVGLPILSKLVTPKSAAVTMGSIFAFWALGKLSGSRLATLVLKKSTTSYLEKVYFWGVIIMSLGFILTFQQTALTGLLLFALAAGVGDGLSEVALATRVQQENEDIRLPVFSLLSFLQMTGFGIGMLIVSPFYEFLQPHTVIIIFHGFPLVVIGCCVLRNRFRKIKMRT